MGFWNWITGVHDRDLARKALHRLRDGYPLPGDVQRAQKVYADLGELIQDHRKLRK